LTSVQLEKGSFNTSQIKTESTSVTRTKDVHTRDVSNLITQVQGGLYCEFECLGVNTSATPYILSLSDSSADNTISLLMNDDGDIRAEIVNSTSSQGAIDSSPITYNTSHKVLITYETNSMKLYVDGSLIGTDTSVTVPTGLTTLNVGSDAGDNNQINGTIKNIKYYKEVLSEVESKRKTQ